MILAVWCGSATVSARPQPAGNDTFQQTAAAGSEGAPGSNPEKWFAEGQTALETGDLDAAEAAF
ncbi:MAG: co-chaperone YbbN, partial [Acidobacteria bacterium]